MQADIQLIAARLKKAELPITVHFGRIKETAINRLALVESLPACPDEYTLYAMKSSRCPAAIPTGQITNLVCVKEGAFPPWLLSCEYFNTIIIPNEELLPRIEAIIREFRDARLKFLEAQSDMLEALYYGNGLQAICDIGSELFGNTLSMLDTSLKSLAAPRHFPTRVSFLDAAFKRGYSDNRDIRFLKAQGWFDPQRHNRTVAFFPQETFSEYEAWSSVCGCCVGYVRANGVVLAYILICIENGEFLDYYYNWLEKIVQLVSVELQKNKEFLNQEGSLYEAFLVDILEKRITDSTMIYRRSQLLGRNLKKHLWIITVRKRFEFRNISFSLMEQKRIRALFPGCISAVYQDDLILLVSNSVKEIPFQDHMETLEQFLENNGLMCGISNSFFDISAMANFYDQSVAALKFGENIHSTGNIFPYFNYTVYHMIENCARDIDLAGLCDPRLLELHRSKDAGDGDLLQTLYLYLTYAKDASRVCAELCIHRSTLFYRLNKIKSALRVNLDDGNEVFRLMLTFRLIEYLDSFSQEEGRKYLSARE